MGVALISPVWAVRACVEKLGGVRGYHLRPPLLGLTRLQGDRGPVSPGGHPAFAAQCCLVHLQNPHQEGMGEARGVPIHCPVPGWPVPAVPITAGLGCVDP